MTRALDAAWKEAQTVCGGSAKDRAILRASMERGIIEAIDAGVTTPTASGRLCLVRTRMGRRISQYGGFRALTGAQIDLEAVEAGNVLLLALSPIMLLAAAAWAGVWRRFGFI